MVPIFHRLEMWPTRTAHQSHRRPMDQSCQDHPQNHHRWPQTNPLSSQRQADLIRQETDQPILERRLEPLLNPFGFQPKWRFSQGTCYSQWGKIPDQTSQTLASWMQAHTLQSKIAHLPSLSLPCKETPTFQVLHCLGYWREGVRKDRPAWFICE